MTNKWTKEDDIMIEDYINSLNKCNGTFASMRSDPSIIGQYYHALTFGKVKDFADFLVIKQKKQLSKQKENMKNIFIKFENNDLVNYVANKLKDKLKPSITGDMSTMGKHKGIFISKDSLTIIGYDKLKTDGEPEPVLFIVTAAKNADTIIEEVIKEYNKPEYGYFTLGGHFNNNSFRIEIGRDEVRFLGNTYSSIEARNFFDKGTATIKDLQIGGNEYVLFTSSNGEKFYATRSELNTLCNRLTQSISF